MRTRVLFPPLLLALALAAPGVAHAESHAGVHVTKCKTGSRAKDRSATYKAWMNSVPGSERMAMRFKLMVHEPGKDGAQSVASSKLAVWHKSHAGVSRYVYSQTVKKLKRGSSYRMRVKFRWYDADGKVIKRATRQSSACVQDGVRPNLIVSAVSVLPGPAPGTAIYGVSVENTGEAAAEGFSVGMFVDGALADSRTIDGLGPGESATVDLNGPTCSRLRAVADLEQAVAETNEDDNVLVSRCY
jgi:CARDB protein